MCVYVYVCACVRARRNAAVTSLYNQAVSLGAGPGVSAWFTIDLANINGTESILDLAAVDSTSGAVVAHNVAALVTPQVCKHPCYIHLLLNFTARIRYLSVLLFFLFVRRLCYAFMVYA